MVGTTTNVVTSVEVTGQHGADSPQLPALLKTTTKRFAVKAVSADRAYIGHANLEAYDAAGAFPADSLQVQSAESGRSDITKRTDAS